jgi:uncharacterized membrane protein
VSTIGAIAQGSSPVTGRVLIQIGLLALIATPIARVAFAVVGFLVRRDWLYVGVGLVVLALLGYGLAAG